MDKRLIWGGFGALLLVGILGGYVPDVRLAWELRKARDEGLFGTTPPRIALAESGNRAFAQALAANRAAAERIRLHPESRGWAPNASTVRFVDDVLEAADRPGRDWVGSDPNALPHSVAPKGMIGISDQSPPLYVVVAGEEIAARAKDEARLLRAVKVASLLNRTGSLRESQLWGNLANRILDRARDLGVSPRAIVREFGPPPEPRRILQTRFARAIESMEDDRAHRNWSVGDIRSEGAYLRSVRSLLREAPQGKGFAAWLRRRGPEIPLVDRHIGGIRTGFIPLPASEWERWATDLDRLRARMEAAR